MKYLLKLFTVITFLSCSINLNSQEDIGKDTYFFGSREININGKVLVIFNDTPFKTQRKIIKQLNKKYEAINILDLTMGNTNMDSSEFVQLLNENGIDKIFEFREENSRYVSLSKSKSKGKSRRQLFTVIPLDQRKSKSESYGSSSEILAMIEMSLSVYDRSNIVKPICFVTSKIDVGRHINEKVSKKGVGKENRTVLSERLLKKIIKRFRKHIK